MTWKPTIAPEPLSGGASAVSGAPQTPSNALRDGPEGKDLSESQPTREAFIPRGRRIKPSDLMGATEVCDLVGWRQRKSILDAMRTAGFPQPAAKLAGGSIWDGVKVRKWLEQRGRPSTEEQAR